MTSILTKRCREDLRETFVILLTSTIPAASFIEVDLYQSSRQKEMYIGKEQIP